MSIRAQYPFLGFGVGLRVPHYREIIEEHPAIDWFEVISENHMVDGGRPLAVLDQVNEQYPVVLHGVPIFLLRNQPVPVQ